MQKPQGCISVWLSDGTAAKIFCLLCFNATYGRIFAGRAANPRAIAMKRYSKQRHGTAAKAPFPYLAQHTHFRVGRSVEDKNFQRKGAQAEIDPAGGEAGRRVYARAYRYEFVEKTIHEMPQEERRFGKSGVRAALAIAARTALLGR